MPYFLNARAMLLAVALACAHPAFAHHGWSWSTGENVELTGTIVEARLGNPHGEVDLDVDGETYTVEVGQPWRNDRAGLTPEHFSPGTRLRVSGEVPTDPDVRELKVERLWIDGTLYELYPGRE